MLLREEIVSKFIEMRIAMGLSMKKASISMGMSSGYLSDVESKRKPASDGCIAKMVWFIDTFGRRVREKTIVEKIREERAKRRMEGQ